MRFELYHHDDFLEVDWTAWATDMWHAWLQHEDNAPFWEHYHKQTEGAQESLQDTVLKPFQQLDEIRNEWNFEEGDTPSCYLYVRRNLLGLFHPI